MTNEHAIDVIKHLKKYYNDKNEWEDGYIGFDNEDNEAIDLAIKALEAQPSEDCISRKAVLDVINFEDEWLFDAKSHNADTKIAFSAIKSKISELPSVTPRRDLAETSQDCISREGALLALTGMDLPMDRDKLIALFAERIQNLPPVTPKYTDEEIDKAQAVEQAYVDKMVELAVEETKRPKGKWIKIEYDVCTFIYKCSKCGMRVVNPYKYCPNCGSDNGGGEDEG